MRIVLLIVFNILTLIAPFAQDPKLMLPIGHTSTINSLDLTKDQEYLLSASDDQSVKVWNGKFGTIRLNLRLKDQVKSVRLSHNEKLIVAAASGDAIKIFDSYTGALNLSKKLSGWPAGAVFTRDDTKVLAYSSNEAVVFDASSGNDIFRVPAGKYTLLRAVFSPNEKQILTCGRQGDVNVWDVVNKKKERHLHDAIGYVYDASFSHDGKKVLVVSDTSVMVWSTGTGLPLFNLKPGKDEFRAARFSNDDRYIVTGTWHTNVVIWNAETGVRVRTINRSADLIEFSPDGKKTALGGGDSHGVTVIELATGKTITQVYPRESVSQILFSKTGKSFITGTIMGHLDLFDTENGEWLLTFNGHVHPNWTSRISPDGSTIMTAPYDGSLKLWDLKKGELKKTIWNAGANPVFSQDGKKIIVPCRDSTARVIDAATGEALVTLSGHNNVVTLACFNKEATMALTCSYNYDLKIWDLATGKTITTVSTPDLVRHAGFSPNGDHFFMFYFRGDYIEVREPNTGALIYRVKNDNGQIDNFRYTSDGKLFSSSSGPVTLMGNALTGEILFHPKEQGYAGVDGMLTPDGARLLLVYKNRLEMLDWRTKQLIDTAIYSGHELDKAAFSPDGRYLITASEQGRVQCWTTQPLRLIRDLEGHEGGVYSMDFSADGKWLTTCGADHTGKLWNLSAASLVYTFFALGTEDYITLLPSRYYRSTPTASRMLYYLTNNLELVSFEQLDLKYNRPDLVLKATGSSDKQMIATFYEAYQKRIKRSGFDSLSLQNRLEAPEFEIVNRDDFKFGKQYPSTVTLRLKIADKNQPLDRFNLWINEVPLWNAQGISLKHRRSGNFDTTITITLTEGHNFVEGSAMNTNGVESLRKSFVITKVPDENKKKNRKLYFIGIAVERFADSLNNLLWSVKDIRALGSAFKEKYGSRNIRIDTLFNEHVSPANIRHLKKKLRQADINDVVVLAYSGHGLLSSNYDYYFPTCNTDFSTPEKGGIAYDSLESLLDEIPPRQKLMIVDACHSGEVDKSEMINAGPDGNPLPGYYQPKGGGMAPHTVFELMQELYPDVGRNNGTTILSASRGTQTANEWDEIKHSIFTYSILELLQQKQHASVWELKEYTYRRVMELTDGAQKPTTRKEIKTVDWNVW